MKQDVRLYINDQLVDMSSELSMPFVYQLEDTDNPTIVKNSFTKTISIVGTKQNNKIFGDIYNFDREQLYNDGYLTGAYFNPSYRTPFEIYKDGEIIESGYMQLNSITIKNKIINYEITLYGGIGNFFYNLMYNKNNEPLTLADLIYGVEDEDGNVLGDDEEFDFSLTKEFVKKCWDNIENKNGQITDFINFAPCYDGLYENFDNNKVLINLNDCKAFTTSAVTENNVRYTTYNGYAMAELKKDYTEWEMRDLRSYQQRPVIKLKKVIEACCNPENNGGYEVVLDNDFFNGGNAYWEKAYIALPMLSSLLKDTQDDEILVSNGIDVNKRNSYIGLSGDTYSDYINFDINPTGDGWVVDESGYIDTSSLNISSLFSAEIDLQLLFNADNYTSPLYQSVLLNGKSGNLVYNNHPIYQSIIAQIMVYNGTDIFPIAYSNIYNFTNKLPNGAYSKPSDWVNFWNMGNMPATTIFGHWEYSSELDKHYFVSDEGSNTFKINIDNVKKYDELKFVLQVNRVSDDGLGNSTSRMWKKESINISDQAANKVNGYWDSNVYTDSTISVNWSKDITSNIKITKDLLLKTEKTPADYLLSYTKLFGLKFRHDLGSKTIYIQTRSNYFQNIIEDWEDRIDWSKDIKINPILFDKKFYLMNLESEDNYFLNKYKNEYGVDYGQKRVNTAYNFNNETKKLYDDNVFQNAISVTDTSVYYRSFYNSASTSMPAFAVDGLTYRLFNTDASENNEITMNNLIVPSKTIAWNKIDGYDVSPKTAFYTLDADKKSLADISSCLLFYNGEIYTENLNGDKIQYWLSDDVVEMSTLNDGKACYIYTESAFTKNNAFIAYPLERIPQFLRYDIVGNTIVSSWDFAVPKETLIPNINYDSSTTIYDSFWSNFYQDQLNINTKKITAYVNLHGLNVNGELLRKFYYFGNSYWLLNKIVNYNINKWGTTQCEFIKVNQLNNYLTPIQNSSYFGVDKNDIVVDYKAGSYSVNVQSSGEWRVDWYNSYKIESITPSAGTAGNTEVVVKYNENNGSNFGTGYEANYFYFTIITDAGERISIDFKQTPNPESAVTLSGFIKYVDGGLLPSGRILITDATNTATVYDSRYTNDYTGEYKLYVPKNKTIRIEIQANIEYGGDMVYETTAIFDKDSTRNFIIPKS